MKISQLVLLMIGLLYNTSTIAEVESMSLEKFKNIDGERYWEVSVLCQEDSAEKLMKRVVGEGNLWCSANDDSLCEENKFTLSQLLCGSQETNSDASSDTSAEIEQTTADEVATDSTNNETAALPSEIESSSASVDTETLKTRLLKEQVQIEEQRILLEQKRLELVQRELELKKQLAN